MHTMIYFFKKDIVFSVSLILAVISCFLIPPSIQYISYIDFHTLILLASLMLIIAGLQKQSFFHWIGHNILNSIHTKRGIIFSLVFLCFISSMFITNDVSLITFVPFGIMILEMANLIQHLCLTVTLMTIAANLGSMMTPIGNPQNLYLYSLSQYSLKDFLSLMFPYTLFCAIILVIFIFIGYKQSKLNLQFQDIPLKHRQTIITYILLFLLSLLTVAGFIPHIFLLTVVIMYIFIKDRSLFLDIDYRLLFTFIFFFIFVGNIKHIESFNAFISGIIHGNERIISIMLSQLISNVPTAMLLSHYTQNINELIIGTNIGGLGTMIASMASLISYKQVVNQFPQYKKKYFIVFTLCNIVCLMIFIVFYLIE